MEEFIMKKTLKAILLLGLFGSMAQAMEKPLSNMQPEFATQIQVFPYICKICFESFQNNPDLKNHINLMHIQSFLAKENTPHIVPQTNKSSTSQDLFKKTSICPHCSHKYFSNKQLRDHMTSQHEEIKYEKQTKKENNFICSVCSKVFLSKWRFQEHKKLHPELLKFTCEICSKTFISKNQRTKHINNIHSEVKHKPTDSNENLVTPNMYEEEAYALASDLSSEFEQWIENWDESKPAESNSKRQKTQ